MGWFLCSLCFAWLALGCEDPGCLRHSECNSGYECKDSRCVKIPVDAGTKGGAGGAGGKGGKSGLLNPSDAGTKKTTGGTSGAATTSMDASMPASSDTTDVSGGAGGTT
jgi:hypothetical protein